ncbi:MAG TPA: murein biosynthesis integral membrane protein MurJ [Gemmatirosa sp.]
MLPTAAPDTIAASDGTEVDAPGAIAPGPPAPVAARAPERTGRFAAFIAIGILSSRILGLVRTAVFSHYLGAGPAADAFNAALKIPNYLQNLFGEGVLSASFIPVYARLLGAGERDEADRVAAAVGAILALTVALLVAVGMLATPLLVTLVATGFRGDTRELAVRLVRITFPGIGLLVMSAWCLGILNSHRRFLLSYLAPVGMNVVLIATLVHWGGRGLADDRLATTLAWGVVVGSAVQLFVQVPTVLRVAPGLWRRTALSPSLRTRVRDDVRTVVRNFGPVFVGRGVVQLSAFIDSTLASLIAPGALTVFANAQQLYLLPGSLFGMSISAAELPAMSSLQGRADEVAALLRERLSAGLRRIAFFVIPSAVAFVSLGDVIAGAAFHYGRFTRGDVVWVWGTLAGSAVGLLASTLGRLYSSTFYALKETRTPLRLALVRVALTLALGYVAAVPLPRALGISPRWGTAGLTATAGVAGWVEFLLLRRALNRRIGPTGIPGRAVTRLWGAALASGAVGIGAKFAAGRLPAVALAGLVCGAYGVSYLAITAALGEGESAAVVRRLRRRLGGPARA